MTSIERMISAPEVLCVQEDIFRFENGFGIKKPKSQRRNEPAFEVSVRIGDAIVKYELCSMVLHSGLGINRGHYVAYVKLEDNGWIECNDELVTRMKHGPNIQCYDLYLSFYRKI